SMPFTSNNRGGQLERRFVWFIQPSWINRSGAYWKMAGPYRYEQFLPRKRGNDSYRLYSHRHFVLGTPIPGSDAHRVAGDRFAVSTSFEGHSPEPSSFRFNRPSVSQS